MRQEMIGFWDAVASARLGIVELCDYARVILRIIGDLAHNWANPA